MKRGIIILSVHKTRLGFDRKNVTCWIVVNKKIQNSIDIVWLGQDCFAAYIFINYLGRRSRVITHRSSSIAGYIACVVDYLTLMLEAQVPVPSPLGLWK